MNETEKELVWLQDRLGDLTNEFDALWAKSINAHLAITPIYAEEADLLNETLLFAISNVQSQIDVVEKRIARLIT